MNLVKKMDAAVADLVQATKEGRPAFSVVPASGKALLDEVFAGWKRLVEEPLEYKRSWLFDIRQVAAGEQPDPDHGLIIRLGSEGELDPNTNEPYDDKHFFMFRPHLIDMLEYRSYTAEPTIDLERYRPWLRALTALHEAQMVTIRAFADAVDRRFKGVNARAEIETCRNLQVLRLLHYGKPTKDTTGLEVIAKLHSDRDFVTSHIGENYEGLADADGKVISFGEDESGLFGGRKLQIATGGRMIGRKGRKPEMRGGKIQAFEHAVVETKGRNEPRVSAVFFAHTRHSIH